MRLESRVPGDEGHQQGRRLRGDIRRGKGITKGGHDTFPEDRAAAKSAGKLSTVLPAATRTVVMRGSMPPSPAPEAKATPSEGRGKAQEQPPPPPRRNSSSVDDA